MFDIDFSQDLHTLSIAFVPALLGIILHEVAHGWMALQQGDPTAKYLGRLTLNPLSHIDPTGLLVFILTSLSGAFVFGWAKPVPVDPRFFRNPLKGMMLVALAGPLTNFLLALGFALGLWLAVHSLSINFLQNNTLGIFLLSSLQMGVIINIGLGWLNLLPVPPLDGSKVLAYFLPNRWNLHYLRAGRYGFIILLVLLCTGLLNKILVPLILGSVNGLFTFLGLH